jgi:transposase
MQAPAPARLIEGGLPTEATIAQVLVSKYADPCAPLRPAPAVKARRRRSTVYFLFIARWSTWRSRLFSKTRVKV